MPKVTNWEIRDLFNSNGIWDRVIQNEYTLQRISCRPPAVPMPHGTRSMYMAIMDGTVKVAEVHYYQLPDGSIGGSGKPDPKVLCINGEVYWT